MPKTPTPHGPTGARASESRRVADRSTDHARALDVPLAIGVGVASLVALVWGWLAPSAVAAPAMAGMSMTHYMELLSVRQPWNLLFFMGVPVVLAETLAITELIILLKRAPGWVHLLSRAAGLLAGPVMVFILVHLLRNAVVPLTAGGGWRGWADVVAVGAYLLGALPMMAITLVEIGVLGRTERQARLWHTASVAVFLVVAHIAMILGMLDPAVTGYGAQMDMPAGQHTMPGGQTMPNSQMPGSQMPHTMPMSQMPTSMPGHHHS